jgi:predicted dehydrogenase
VQERSKGVVWSAKDFIQSGKLGKISHIEMSQPVFQQRWRIPGSEKALGQTETMKLQGPFPIVYPNIRS